MGKTEDGRGAAVFKTMTGHWPRDDAQAEARGDVTALRHAVTLTQCDQSAKTRHVVHVVYSLTTRSRKTDARDPSSSFSITTARQRPREATLRSGGSGMADALIRLLESPRNPVSSLSGVQGKAVRQHLLVFHNAQRCRKLIYQLPVIRNIWSYHVMSCINYITNATKVA